MPKRTNAFQELVTLVQRTLAPVGATVTESAMVRVEGVGWREIDILMESEVGPYRIKISVEAKDHSRKLDNKAIDEIVGKYRGVAGIKVDKIVLVSHRGFAKTAIRRAKLENVELFTLTEAGAGIKKMLRKPKVQRSLSAVGVHVARVGLKPAPAGQLPSDAMITGRLICKCCGKDAGSPWDYANRLWNKEIWPSQRIRDELHQLLKVHSQAKGLNVSYAIDRYLFRMNGEDYPVTHVDLEVHGSFREVLTTAKSYNFASADGSIQNQIRVLASDIGSKNAFKVVVPETKDGSPPKQVTVQIGPGLFPDGLICMPAHRSPKGDAKS